MTALFYISTHNPPASHFLHTLTSTIERISPYSSGQSQVEGGARGGRRKMSTLSNIEAPSEGPESIYWDVPTPPSFPKA